MANRLLTEKEVQARVLKTIANSAKKAGIPKEELMRQLVRAYPYGMIG